MGRTKSPAPATTSWLRVSEGGPGTARRAPSPAIGFIPGIRAFHLRCPRRVGFGGQVGPNRGATRAFVPARAAFARGVEPRAKAFDSYSLESALRADSRWTGPFPVRVTARDAVVFGTSARTIRRLRAHVGVVGPGTALDAPSPAFGFIPGIGPAGRFQVDRAVPMVGAGRDAACCARNVGTNHPTPTGPRSSGGRRLRRFSARTLSSSSDAGPSGRGSSPNPQPGI